MYVSHHGISFHFISFHFISFHFTLRLLFTCTRGSRWDLGFWILDTGLDKEGKAGCLALPCLDLESI